jgi:hypothetical protein
MSHRKLQTIVAALCLAAFMVSPADSQQGNVANGLSAPAPRWPDGRINLGTVAGEKGVWVPPNAGDERLVDLDSSMVAPINPFAIETNPLQRTPRPAGITAATAAYPGKLTVAQVPFLPWARALYGFRAENQLEPHIRCKASGGPRQFLTPYGVEFVDLPELQRIYIMDIGGAHSMRIIYMNAPSHPKNLAPSDYGNSIGHWEGDTLVVDTVGFNEGFWIDRQGTPHTDRLHLTESFSRSDFNTLKYQFTIDDPGAYSAPWSSGILLRWAAGQELFEYICQDNNLAPELAVGQAESIERRSAIAP